MRIVKFNENQKIPIIVIEFEDHEEVEMISAEWTEYTQQFDIITSSFTADYISTDALVSIGNFLKEESVVVTEAKKEGKRIGLSPSERLKIIV